MKKEKRLAGLLAIMMIFFLASCGQTNGESQTEQIEESAVGSTISLSANSGEIEKPADYPSKTINWIVPVAAGATVDLPCRGLVDVLDLGTNVVIENIAGASQTVGTTEASLRDADGYTWLTMANACGIIQPLINDVAYDVADFRNIAMIAPAVPTVLAVRTDSEIETVEDWLELLDSGEKYSYGIPNAGGIGHLALATTLETLGHSGESNATMAVYNGGAENLTALLSGEVDFTVLDASDALSRVESGEIRIIAIMADEPCSLFPDVPVMSEYGVEGLGTFVGIKWIAVRKETPEEIVAWLKQEINEAVQSEEYQTYLQTQGYGNGAFHEYTEEEIDALLSTAREDYAKALALIGLRR